MKKIISIILVLVLVLGLTACGGTKEPQPENTTEQTSAVQTVTVTIPEGYTLLRIAWLLEDKGLCTANEFIEATQTANEWLDMTSYPFLEETFNSKNVCFYLEGYIFPLTYNIPKDADAKSIIKTFLNGTKQKYNDELLARVKASGYTLHEILTIASVIEKEAYDNEQREMISSVLCNRIKANMKFECDVTTAYCEGVIKVYYPDKYNELIEYYSSKRCVGIMAGPICNPGIESINAAINPAESDYLYFIVGTVPPYEAKYSKTFEEHNAFWQANKDRLTGKA